LHPVLIDKEISYGGGVVKKGSKKLSHVRMSLELKDGR
jgi:hypothetical protein